MLETNDLVLIGVLCCVLSGLFGVIIASILHYLRNRVVESRISQLENRLDSVDMAVRGASGRTARMEKTERMQQAMLEAAAIMKNPEIPDKQKALIELALKFPDVSLGLLQKGIKI